MSTTSFRLDDDLQEKLDTTANRIKRSKGCIINDSITRFFIFRKKDKSTSNSKEKEKNKKLEWFYSVKRFTLLIININFLLIILIISINNK
jgi:hypothetical protein